MDPVFRAAKDDPQMRAAIRKARKTFPDFLVEADADLCRAIPVLEDAMVKLGIASPEDPDAVEHVWARYVGHDPEDEGRFRAILLSYPRKLPAQMAKGDEINFSIRSLSDWLYVSDDKAHGAFTVRLLRSRMTPAELKKHDAAYTFSFDDGAPEPEAGLGRGGTKRKRGSRPPGRRGR
jgi:uncharacterized protein YegJ (DUF2314 family)